MTCEKHYGNLLYSHRQVSKVPKLLPFVVAFVVLLLLSGLLCGWLLLEDMLICAPYTKYPLINESSILGIGMAILGDVLT